MHGWEDRAPQQIKDLPMFTNSGRAGLQLSISDSWTPWSPGSLYLGLEELN